MDLQPAEREGGIKQNDLSEALEEAQFASLKAEGSTDDKARLEAAATVHAVPGSMPLPLVLQVFGSPRLSLRLRCYPG